MTEPKMKKRALRRLALSWGTPLLMCAAFGCATASVATDPAVSGDQAAIGQKAAADTMNRLPRVAVPLIEHRLSPDQVRAKGAEAEAACRKAMDAIAAVPPESRTFGSTVDAFEQSLSDYMDAVNRLTILKDVHPEKDVRLAAADVEEAAGKYLVELMARRDVYAALDGYAKTAGAKEKLDPEQRRLMDLTLRDFRRNGLSLPEEQQKKLVAIQQRLVELQSQFGLNLNSNTSHIVVTEAELQGLPEAYVKRLKDAPDGKGKIVTCKYPDYFPFMENAVDGAARRRLYVAFQTREAEKNTPLMKEAIRLRDQAAKLLGYQNHADFVTEERMAKSSGNVKAFLEDLRARLVPRRDADYAKLTALKREMTGDANAVLEPWDTSFYFNQLKKRDWALDTEAIRAYFPMETVLKGLFSVYEQLFSIRIARVEGADTWANVPLFEITDASDGSHVAHFYLDLYPREGKYGHAAAAGVTVARRMGDKYLAPIALMMTNFNPSTPEAPSLLSHDEVETLFHEFGHIMHQTLTAARYGSLSGTAVARDFVEAPSQMLENWVFEKDVLDRMSGHYQDPSKKLPAETVAKLKAARTFNAGYHYTRQIFLALFDQAIHTSGPDVDVDAVDRELYAKVLALKPVEEARFPATFNHLMGGYDSGYYGYLWSEVFADDMFTKFKANGVLDAATGMSYRRNILEPGKMLDADVLLKNFLGREPNKDAFLEKLGIQ